MSCQLLVMNTGISTLGSGNVTDGLKYVRSSIIHCKCPDAGYRVGQTFCCVAQCE